jgi:hypothetical protein
MVIKQIGRTMSQNVTLQSISPAQSSALRFLVSGGSVTNAAQQAGVARETVSRWLHHDPVFIAEMHNARAELASQTRCALEALGMQAVGVLVSAVQDQFVKPWRLKAACAVLKMIGADRAETMRRTTAEEIQLWLQERDAELEERRGKLKPSEVSPTRSVEAPDDSGAAVAAPMSTENPNPQPCASGDVTEPAPMSTQKAELLVAPPAHHMANGKLGPIDKIDEDVISQFLDYVDARVNQQHRSSAPPITIVPRPVDGPLRGRDRRLRRSEEKRCRH